MSYNGLLINTCTVFHAVVGTWGETTYTSTPHVKCRIVYANKMVRDFRGELVVSTARVFFLKSVVINDGDRLHFDGRYHGIQAIDRDQDSAVLHHIEVAVD